jgi:ubiquinone/menaquinone biosynthesis C-methylase UbiE
MTAGDDTQTWTHLAQSTTVSSLVEEHRHPPSYRADLARIVTQRSRPGSAVLEAGCFTGLSSALLAATRRCTLLDLSPEALDLARLAFEGLGLQGEFVVGDLFAMPFDDGAFDVVFNSGVLEHFKPSQRRAALVEMTRVTAPGGLLCVAVPNHHSFPYRLAYLIRRATGHWKYPPEKKIRSLARELRSLGLCEVQTQVVASDLRFRQLGMLPFAVRVCGWLEKVRGQAFGGYLEVGTGVKKPAGS